MKYLLILMLLLTACSSTQLEPVKVITETVKPIVYNPPLPRPVQIENIRWYVITKENMDDQIITIEKMQDKFVVFAMTPQAYENMAANLQEIKRYTEQLKQIVEYYRDLNTQEENTINNDGN